MPQTQEATATTILSVKENFENLPTLWRSPFSLNCEVTMMPLSTSTRWQWTWWLVRQSERFRVKGCWVKTGFCFKYRALWITHFEGSPNNSVLPGGPEASKSHNYLPCFPRFDFQWFLGWDTSLAGDEQMSKEWPFALNKKQMRQLIGWGCFAPASSTKLTLDNPIE